MSSAIYLVLCLNFLAILQLQLIHSAKAMKPKGPPGQVCIISVLKYSCKFSCRHIDFLPILLVQSFSFNWLSKKSVNGSKKSVTSALNDQGVNTMCFHPARSRAKIKSSHHDLALVCMISCLSFSGFISVITVSLYQRSSKRFYTSGLDWLSNWSNGRERYTA